MLVCHSAHIDLLRKILVIGLIRAGIFRATPAHDRAQRMDQHRVVVGKANRLNCTSKVNRILHGGDRQISIEILRRKFPIRMDFHFNQFTLLRRVFEISQIMRAGYDISVGLIVMRLQIALGPEAMRG